jgi:autotransporter-associated beta strand protein
MRSENVLSCSPFRVVPARASLLVQSLFLGSTVFFCLASGANAADLYWNVATGDWPTTTNWLPLNEPTASDDAYINNGGTASMTQLGETCRYLYLGDAATESGSIDQSGGTNTVKYFLYLGNSLNSQGTYNLSGSATLSAAREYIGYSGAGTFVQTGGTNSVLDLTYGELYLGYNATAHGSYTLSAGSLSAYGIIVGNKGSGTFEQNGGTISHAGLTLGSEAGSSGSYTLSNGSLTAGNAHSTVIGSSGTGTFTQTGGTHSNTSGYFMIGYASSSNGTYNLSETGQLSSWITNVGYSGTGTFTQTGGTHTVGYELHLATNNSLATGTYNLSGTGSLSTVYNEYIGEKGTGTFDQTGGSNTVTSASGIVYLGYNTGSKGTYKMSGSGTLSTPYLIAGKSGRGSIEQSGGTITVSQYLALGYSSGASGTYDLSGTGSLSVAWDEYVGSTIHESSTGTGTFTQSGGTNTVSGDLHLGYKAGSSGTYNLYGGVLSAGGPSGGGEDVGAWGTGTFTHTGGTHYTGDFHVAGYGGTGTYSLSGSGQLIVSTDEWIPRSGYGTFTQTGGTNSIAGSLIMGVNPGSNYDPGSTGTYNLNGGTLILKSISLGPGTTFFNFGGGTLQASGDLSTALNMTLTGTGGNANIDSDAYHVAISGLLSGSGGVNKRGTGTLTLSAANSYSGPTTVAGGTLEIAGGIDSSGTTLLDIQSGTAILKSTNVNRTSLNVHNATSATFEVANGTHTVGDITGGGTTKIDNGASLTANSIVQNTLTIGAGASVTIHETTSSSVNAVPEPSLFALLGVGAIGLLAYAWRRRAST